MQKTHTSAYTNLHSANTLTPDLQLRRTTLWLCFLTAKRQRRAGLARSNHSWQLRNGNSQTICYHLLMTLLFWSGWPGHIPSCQLHSNKMWSWRQDLLSRALDCTVANCNWTPKHLFPFSWIMHVGQLSQTENMFFCFSSTGSKLITRPVMPSKKTKTAGSSDRCELPNFPALVQRMTLACN